METRKIIVFGGNQPCLNISKLDVKEGTPNYGIEYGLNRDRNPDSSWSELRETILSEGKLVDLTDDIKIILLEDLAYAYGSDTKLFNQKLKEFNLI